MRRMDRDSVCTAAVIVTRDTARLLMKPKGDTDSYHRISGHTLKGNNVLITC